MHLKIQYDGTKIKFLESKHNQTRKHQWFGVDSSLLTSLPLLVLQCFQVTYNNKIERDLR